MMTQTCCKNCHKNDGMCTQCLGEDTILNSKKELLTHLGYLALHLVQIILIVKM